MADIPRLALKAPKYHWSGGLVGVAIVWAVAVLALRGNQIAVDGLAAFMWFLLGVRLESAANGRPIDVLPRWIGWFSTLNGLALAVAMISLSAVIGYVWVLAVAFGALRREVDERIQASEYANWRRKLYG